MTSFIQNILWNSVSGFVEAGTRTAGGYAGDALIKAGDLLENGGRGLGNSIERKATGLGGSISGQTYQPSAKPLPSTARRPAAHRSNSLPANSKPTTGTPLGAKKNPGAGAGAAKKQIGNGVTGAKGTAGGLVGGAKGAVGGVGKGLGSVNKGVGGAVSGAKSTATRNLPKPYPQSSAAANKTSNLPKPYGNTSSTNKSSTLPKPYGNNSAFPSNEKKTAVRPGQSKPFKPEQKDEPKPYPGTNTLPGQASKTPVKKYKPLPRLAAPAETGQVKHLAF
ncbi:hypothetical protein N0V90_002348 [Kalmusia sp. IMI 367209]|nr:hypothetical protein N0V90_002348 [Kalmusia sp. IMI 367209]